MVAGAFQILRSIRAPYLSCKVRLQSWDVEIRFYCSIHIRVDTSTSPISQLAPYSEQPLPFEHPLGPGLCGGKKNQLVDIEVLDTKADPCGATYKCGFSAPISKKPKMGPSCRVPDMMGLTVGV